MANLQCSDSTFLSELYCTGCAKLRGIRSRQSAGRPFLLTTARSSLQWIFSPCRRGPSVCCIVFFVIAHDRRRILHFNVTRHPTSAWVSQQMREAFPCDSAPRYLIFDRDATFSAEVVETTSALGVKSVRTLIKSPWQNGIAGRFVGSCRRDVLDRVIVLNERHLKRTITEYLRYYRDDRTHLGLEKQTPTGRKAAEEASAARTVVAMPRLGGLHHRYDRAA